MYACPYQLLFKITSRLKTKYEAKVLRFIKFCNLHSEFCERIFLLLKRILATFETFSLLALYLFLFFNLLKITYKYSFGIVNFRRFNYFKHNNIKRLNSYFVRTIFLLFFVKLTIFSFNKEIMI